MARRSGGNKNFPFNNEMLVARPGGNPPFDYCMVKADETFFNLIVTETNTLKSCF